MKILMYSPSFYPKIGGLETVVLILAREFVECGYSLKVISSTPANDEKKFPFEVIRRPSLYQLLQLTHWCDVFFQGNISLKGIWPLLLVHKPLVVTHQSWYQRLNGTLSWQDHLKNLVTRFSTNICASHALAERITSPSTVIPNPYRQDIFYEIPEIKRDKELVFLGRLVSDKGADLLLDAIANLKALGLTPKLTLIGSGPEEANLRQQVKRLDINHQVEFAGVKFDQELAQALNAHQILIVPSRWEEPFGIVALEGIACGCVVVGSDGGGLKEAIGSCGLTFPNGNVQALTEILIELLTGKTLLSKYRENAISHLSRHTSTAVAQGYLEILERVVT
ncbi:glycosyltransferase family 4 protein [Roseofilum sp. BLCC_M154]|uniref:Glycosyltransferase family 4 protein n=1 Tax=Roseofilum acuticapitatum BLCC-M154 TaxID=3022444 RepID=A0ABT7AMK4_9CYAN|nr:glycosyltransferase family 4 protein [Roseofilum acuticapitatum]MDJ1168132.1 glycosyltransferase family 4 protein [Roseofilum acuticapitatum BLCC-M154]